MSRDPLSKTEYRDAVYFDFEGVGKSKVDKTSPEPKLCGFFRPHLTGRGGDFECTCFDATWKPIVSGNKEANYQNFNDCFLTLLDEIHARDVYLVHWTNHERDILKTYLREDIFESIDTYLHNLHPVAKKYVRVTNKFGDKSQGKGRSLSEFYQAIYPSREEQPVLEIGAAEACRRLNNTCNTTKRWRRFSEKQQTYARNLIAYNKGDCLSTWLIAKRLGSFFETNQFR